MDYEALLDKADRLDIVVKEADLITKDGYCKGNRIAINKKIKTDSERKCILIEELGHYYLTVGDITDQTIMINRKQELLARRWGYRKLIPLESFIGAYEDCIHGNDNLAEYFGVTERFLLETVEYYKCKFGLLCDYRNYIIYFEPLGVLKKF